LCRNIVTRPTENGTLKQSSREEKVNLGRGHGKCQGPEVGFEPGGQREKNSKG
jgi:hypothetical protein